MQYALINKKNYLIADYLKSILIKICFKIDKILTAMNNVNYLPCIKFIIIILP